MKFENIESIGDEDNWAEKLTSQVSLMTLILWMTLIKIKLRLYNIYDRNKKD